MPLLQRELCLVLHLHPLNASSFPKLPFYASLLDIGIEDVHYQPHCTHFLARRRC